MASEQANKTGQETHRRGWWVVVNAGECGWVSRPVVIWWWEVVQVYSCPVLNACSEGLVLASIKTLTDPGAVADRSVIWWAVWVPTPV